MLIGVNALVFLMITVSGRSTSRLVEWLALVPQGRCDSVNDPGFYFPGVTSAETCTSSAVGVWRPGVDDGAYWQLITSAFTHVEVWHFGFNMLALWVLGPQLEAAIGRTRFLVLYFGSALAGSAMVYWFSPVGGYTLGASGAIFGLMSGLLVVAYKVKGNVQGILIWVGINVLITVVGRGFISWQGHLGGLPRRAADRDRGRLRAPDQADPGAVPGRGRGAAGRAGRDRRALGGAPLTRTPP